MFAKKAMEEAGDAEGVGEGSGRAASGDVESDTDTALVPVASIAPNPEQPRKHFDEEALAGLADSLARHGLLQPLVVRRAGDGYELIAGERRLRAAIRAGLDEVPVTIRDSGAGGPPRARADRERPARRTSRRSRRPRPIAT